METFVKSTRKELLEVLEAFSTLKAHVVGDFILDRYIWGSVDRISPEAPVPVVHIRKVEDRLGGAGNVVRNLRKLDVAVTATGLIGEDQEGQALLNLLHAENVSTESFAKCGELPTVVKTRVIAHSQQVVRIDREETGEVQETRRDRYLKAVSERVLQSDLAIVSDYGKGVITGQLMSMMGDLHSKGKVVVLDPHPSHFNLYKGMSLAKPNRKEAEDATGMKFSDRKAALAAGRKLMEQWMSEMMLVSLGEDGLLIVSQDLPEGLHLPTLAREVFDVSGAGDTVTAVFAAAIALKASPQIAGDLANLAAGIVVSEVGTVAVEKAKLQEKIEGLAQ